MEHRHIFARSPGNHLPVQRDDEDFILNHFGCAIDHVLPLGDVHLAFQFVDQRIELGNFSIAIVGFAGAFTSWSTFILDVYLAFELKKYKGAAINLGLSLALGVGAAWIGIHLVR